MRIYGKYDVVVVGGGASGMCAALSAAREGVSVCLIETLGTIGGMLNVTGPPGWAFNHMFNEQGEQILGGIVAELHGEMFKMGLAMDLPKYRHSFAPAYIDIDWAGLLMFEKLREAGVHFLLHTMAVDVLKEGDCVQGVIVENTSGRMAVMGKVIIEATGEGDMAVRAGVPYSKIDRTKEEIDPPSITFHMDGVDWSKVTQYYRDHPDQFIPDYVKGRDDVQATSLIDRRMKALKEYDSIIDIVKAGIVDNIDYSELSMQAINNGDMHPYGDLGHFFTVRQWDHWQPVFQHTAQVVDCDTTDITEYAAGEVEARRQVVIALKAIHKYLPGYDKAYFTRLTSAMRTREGRHMVGDYQLVATDVRDAVKFDDVMAKCMMSVTVGGPFHSAKTPGTAMNIDETRTMYQPKDGGSYDVPYRAFVPKGVEGMLLTGKLVSVTEDFKRDLLPDNMLWGQAAGIAAAVCVRNGKTPRELEKDVSEVQDILRKNGAILDGTH